MAVMAKNKTNRSRLRPEGRSGRHWRQRRAGKKILVPKGTPQPIQPTAAIVTHHDEGSVQNAHAVTAAIVAHDEQEAASVHSQLGDTQGELAASEDELKKDEADRSEQVERRSRFVDKVELAGLGHKVVDHATKLVWLVAGVAIMFEALAMSSPMQLLGVVDFGGGAKTREFIGAFFALLLGIGYAVVLAVLSKRAGEELARRHYRGLLEAEDTHDEGAEDQPRPVSAVFADKVVAVAFVGGGLALLAASVVREAAVAILAAAGQTTVPVSWWVFLALTLGVFVALVCLGYWQANPIAKTYAEINTSISNLDKQIASKRRECFKLAGRVDSYQKQLQMIEARSLHDQLIQLHLAAEEVAWRGAANPHIYGIAKDPTHVQDVVTNPTNHVRSLRVPSLPDTLSQRIENIRNHTAPKGVQPQPVN